jgi:hypothetical protein
LGRKIKLCTYLGGAFIRHDLHIIYIHLAPPPQAIFQARDTSRHIPFSTYPRQLPPPPSTLYQPLRKLPGQVSLFTSQSKAHGPDERFPRLGTSALALLTRTPAKKLTRNIISLSVSGFFSTAPSDTSTWYPSLLKYATNSSSLACSSSGRTSGGGANHEGPGEKSDVENTLGPGELILLLDMVYDGECQGDVGASISWFQTLRRVEGGIDMHVSARPYNPSSSTKQVIGLHPYPLVLQTGYLPVPMSSPMQLPLLPSPFPLLHANRGDNRVPAQEARIWDEAGQSLARLRELRERLQDGTAGMFWLLVGCSGLCYKGSNADVNHRI